jgi:hypothetical protein
LNSGKTFWKSASTFNASVLHPSSSSKVARCASRSGV